MAAAQIAANSLGVEARAADERAVDVRLGEQIAPAFVALTEPP